LQLTSAIELFDTHLTLTGALAASATKPDTSSRRCPGHHVNGGDPKSGR
jgi:hypothetical protein